MSAAAATLPVWGRAVRAGHWALAGCVIGALLLHEGGAWHERLGYGALALATLRGSALWWARAPQLRFAGFVQRPAAVLANLRALRAGTEPRHLGHNPLGGWMILALLGCALTAGASGALSTTDAFWGDPTVYNVHRAAGWALAGLAPLHLAGVLLASWRHRENLVAAMLHGRKRPAGPGDVGLDGQADLTDVQSSTSR